MLRGRHRGLPVAIDRAVMLPIEFGDHFEQDEEVAEQEDDIVEPDTEMGQMPSGNVETIHEKQEHPRGDQESPDRHADTHESSHELQQRTNTRHTYEEAELGEH